MVFSGGQAKALTCPFNSAISQQFSIISCSDGTTNPNPPLNGGTVYDLTWHDTNDQFGNPRPTDKQIKFIKGPTGGAGNIEWQWLDISGNNDWRIPPDPDSVDQWKVDVDFNPAFNLPRPNGIGANPSVFEYIVKITEPGYFFHDVTIGANFLNGDGDSTVTKDIWTAIGHDKDQLLGTLTCTGFANGGAVCDDPFVVPLHLDKLYIVDTATDGGRPIDNYTNTFRQRTKVPAPLPILGAAAAFGSIRKARKFSSYLKTFTMG